MPDSVNSKLITLVGPPNSGKTTLFNFLSGKKHKTVNYPGSTIEYHISAMLGKYGLDASLMDSPGIVSMVPHSPDEEVTINNLFEHPQYGKPSVIVVTVDVSQFSRHLLLLKQILACGFNVVAALTMNDIIESKGFSLDVKKLEDLLGCKAVKIDPRSGKGIDELTEYIKFSAQQGESKLTQRKTFNDELILEIYKDIDDIEKQVIIKNPEIEKANRSLNIKGQSSLFNAPDSLTLKIDNVLLNKFWGFIIFASVMGLLFASIFWIASPLMDMVDTLFQYLSELAVGERHAWYTDLISNGIIGGTGAVLVFLPQIFMLFFILGLLEDSGYLARGAMLIDKPLSKLGLNGRSFVPMLSGFACAIPAIMAARTITNRKERLLTIFIIPLMSCSARLPVYGLLLAFLLPGQYLLSGIILSLIYLFGILTSFLVSVVLNKYQKSFFKTNERSSFIMELPVYRVPKLGNALKNSYENSLQYVKKAGPTILVFSIVLWVLTYFPNTNPVVKSPSPDHETVQSLIESERIATSYASEVGKFIEPVMKPLGLDWRVGVSLIATFAAREVFVSSMALIFRITNDDENLNESMVTAMKNAKHDDSGKPLFTTATAIGLIVFFIFAMQCISTIAVTKKETGGWKIPLLQIGFYSGLAYILTFITVNGLHFLGIP